MHERNTRNMRKQIRLYMSRALPQSRLDVRHAEYARAYLIAHGIRAAYISAPASDCPPLGAHSGHSPSSMHSSHAYSPQLRQRSSWREPVHLWQQGHSIIDMDIRLLLRIMPAQRGRYSFLDIAVSC